MKLEKALNFLQNHIKSLLLIYFLVQLGYILFSNISYKSDSLYYFSLAQQCLKLHTFYPAPVHLYQDYIIAPLYINVLVALLYIYNSPIIIGFFNIVLNFVQLLLVYKITENLFGKGTGKSLIVVYIFYLSTLGMILFNYTELLFNVLIFSSVYFYLQEKNYSLFLAGIFLAASIAVRPIGWALLAAYLICKIFSGAELKDIFKRTVLLISGTLLFIILFGTISYLHFGKFIYTSTTGPVNLIIGANDDATGAYNNKVFDEGKIGFIPQPEKKTYVEKEHHWFKQAIKWIYNHPIKYVSLFPLKIVHMFVWDDFSVSGLLGLKDWNLYRVMKDILTGNDGQLLGNKPFIVKISYFILQILHHLYYFSIVFLFLIITKSNFSIILKSSKLRMFLLFIVLGIGINLLTYGNARYKYPYIITMMILVAPIIYQSTIYKKLILKYNTVPN